VGGYPSAVDFEGFEAQYIRVTQPGTNVEFALAEVEVSPVKAVAPTVGAITVASTPEGAVQSSGDGAFRTATAPKSTLVSLSAKTTGTPEPGLKWQFRSNDSEEWGDIEDETGDEHAGDRGGGDVAPGGPRIARESGVQWLHAPTIVRLGPWS